MQRVPTSRKSGSNAPYRPTNFEAGCRKLECRYKGESGIGLLYSLIAIVRQLLADVRFAPESGPRRRRRWGPS
jgi:hypothetical protein